MFLLTNARMMWEKSENVFCPVVSDVYFSSSCFFSLILYVSLAFCLIFLSSAEVCCSLFCVCELWVQEVYVCECESGWETWVCPDLPFSFPSPQKLPELRPGPSFCWLRGCIIIIMMIISGRHSLKFDLWESGLPVNEERKGRWIPTRLWERLSNDSVKCLTTLASHSKMQKTWNKKIQHPVGHKQWCRNLC